MSDSGEEPPSKKLAIEPTTTTNLPLPEELVLCCLAGVSRLHYPILSLVSKTFRSLTSSPELYQTRSLLNRTENCLYVCLRFPNDPDLRWFTLCRKPDKTLKKKKKKKTSTSGNVLGQVRILGSPPPVEWSNLVAVGHRLYAVSPGPCSSNAFFLDCRTHAWVETPSLRFPHTVPECAGMMYLPGGSENPDSVNCLQVFNVQTQTWNVPPGEKKIFRLRDLQGRAYQNNDVAAAAGSGSGSGTGRWLVVARVKEYTTHLESCDTLCLIDKTFYRYESSSGKLVWSNRYVESDLWRKVQGLEGLPKFPRYSNVYLVQSCGGKLVVFWDKHVRSREEKMIWCAEISLETRSSGDGVWGKAQFCSIIRTRQRVNQRGDGAMASFSTSQPLSLPRHPTFSNPKQPTTNNERSRHTISLIDRCSNLRQLKQIHAQMVRTGLLFDDPYSASKLFAISALSPFASLDYACKVFDQIPQPNSFTWNTLIRAHASGPDPARSILVFLDMVSDSQFGPNKYTFPFLIKAASEVSSSSLGRSLHGMAIKSSVGCDVFVANSLIHCYFSCGDLDSACKVFTTIQEKDVVSWNSMITGFVQKGSPDKALELFKKMESEEDVKASHVTMVGVLSACAKTQNLEFGKRVCRYIEENRVSVNLTLANAMLDMYTKCGSIEDAKRLFDAMEERDNVTWTTMLDGYAILEDYEAAREVLNSMPKKDIVAWNALISAYEQNGKPNEALLVFHELQLQKNIKLNQITLVSTLSACAQVGALELGRWIHSYIKKHGIRLNFYVTSALIHMYSKCGDLEKAREVFSSVEKRDVFVWSAMIGGLAMHGCGNEALDMFYKMQEANVKPNGVTFTNVFCACSHSGLVDEAESLFRDMESSYGIVPEDKHYACIVDVLGRSGYLEKAVKFIEAMPIPPSASVWGALLGACKIHANLSLAEMACTRLLELEPRNDGAHVLLSNIYAKSGKWESVSELRKHMRVTGLKKEPGCSSIEIDGTIHEFLSGDNEHPMCEKVYGKLNEVMERLKENGYEPEMSQVLQIIDEEEMKEQSLNLHSEKLAICYGLISTEAPKAIRVIKNLRVCGDCHSVAKLISQLYDREIIVRDRYRFHHFRNGQCSCNDFW